MRGEFSSSRVATFLSNAASVFTSDTSLVLQIYHQISEAAILVSATARAVRFASSLKRWKTPLYSAMLSTVLSRCHSIACLACHSTRVPHLRRTHAQLTHGTRPSKKLTKDGHVKRYIRTVSVANDGVLIIRDNQPFQPPRERIVVPRPIVDVLLTALHIRFCYPYWTQLKRIFNRYFFALDFDKASEGTSVACHQCQVVKSIPVHLLPQSSTQATTVASISSVFARMCLHTLCHHLLTVNDTTSYAILSSYCVC